MRKLKKQPLWPKRPERKPKKPPIRLERLLGRPLKLPKRPQRPPKK